MDPENHSLVEENTLPGGQDVRVYVSGLGSVIPSFLNPCQMGNTTGMLQLRAFRRTSSIPEPGGTDPVRFLGFT